MKKRNKIFLLLSALPILACSLAISASVGKNEINALADGSEEISEEISLIEEESSEEPAAQSEEKKDEGIVYVVKEAYIGFRDNETDSYGKGNSEIGSYFLSKDGWKEEDNEPIVMTIEGNVKTRLDSKIVYIYEYKPTLVKFAGEPISKGEDKTYKLEKPTQKGEYDLEIYFTKTLITSPVDVLDLNWKSLLTTQNLLTFGSWALLVVVCAILFFLTRKYKSRGTTTVQEAVAQVKKVVSDEFGEKAGDAVTDILNRVISPAFGAIDKKLEKVDGNIGIMLRCLLVMQEDTPEARLAVTKYLSELDTSKDELSAQVKEIIEREIAKRDAEKKAREEAIKEAEEKAEKWAEKSKQPEEKEPEENQDKDDGYGVL